MMIAIALLQNQLRRSLKLHLNYRSSSEAIAQLPNGKYPETPFLNGHIGA
ncbi:MAG: hypothetical protein H0U45_05755 [Tatlockia sp.]|nr:hypothetical protein [Tatlockia sp.]